MAWKPSKAGQIIWYMDRTYPVLPTQVFKQMLIPGKKWRKLDGSDHLAEIIEGVTFKDGIKQIQHAA